MRIEPFRPLVFRDIGSAVTSPPFDTISPEQERQLKSNPHNISHLTLPGPDGPGESARLLREWIREGVLVRMASDAVIVLQQSFRMGHERISRTGVICNVEVFPDRGDIIPHERTFEWAVQERLRVMEATGSHLEPIFLTVQNRNLERVLRRAMQASDPREFEEPIGVMNSVHFVTDADMIREIQETLKHDRAVVADGHHRLEATRRLAARAGTGCGSFWSRVMAYVTTIYDRGLLISGIHRVIVDAGPFSQYRKRMSDFFRMGTEGSVQRQDIMYVYDGQFHSLEPTPAALQIIESLGRQATPIELLSQVIMKRVLSIDEERQPGAVRYTHDLSAAISSVDSKRASFSIIMPPWNKEQFMAVVSSGHLLPQKSTYFYPKIPSGIAINGPQEADTLRCGLP